MPGGDLEEVSHSLGIVKQKMVLGSLMTMELPTAPDFSGLSYGRGETCLLWSY